MLDLDDLDLEPPEGYVERQTVLIESLEGQLRELDGNQAKALRMLINEMREVLHSIYPAANLAKDRLDVSKHLSGLYKLFFDIITRWKQLQLESQARDLAIGKRIDSFIAKIERLRIGSVPEDSRKRIRDIETFVRAALPGGDANG